MSEFVCRRIAVFLTLGVVTYCNLDSPKLFAAAPLERVANVTLTNVPVTAPTFGFTYSNAFPGLSFANPVCLATPPGETNRLFILEKTGTIVVITNLTAPTRSTFLDLTSRVISSPDMSDERGLLGLCFHPGFATNGFFYVFFTGSANTSANGGGNGMHDILARFEVSATDPNQGNPDSYTPILQQYDESNNHNGGDIHFGSDRYLYLGLGDEGDGDDYFNNSQTITKDFFAGMLRIDVDKRPGNLTPNPHPASTTNYLVPADNPFVGATEFNGLPVNPNAVRTEFWAVGLRNPWRWNFDKPTGLLYCGDVGQSGWEEVDLVEAGKNYGWAYREGNANGPKAHLAPPGFVHTPPLLAYPRSSGVCIIGGLVYRGLNISQLYGAYVYADYGFGTVWALRHEGTNVTQNQVLFTDPGRISTFGTDPRNGDILYCDVQQSRIKRIIYNTQITGSPIPEKLSDTGAFTNLATLETAPGIVAYDVNTPFWSDNSDKFRWFSIPDTNLTIAFQREGNWQFPEGAIWIKHFELEITNGVPDSKRRLETRLLIANTNGGYGVTYRWTTPPTNAWLVAENGLDEPITTYASDGSVIRTQVWHYPARVECMVCHTATAGFALGFNTPQLNRDLDYQGTVTNQLAALEQAGYFTHPITNRHLLPALAHATNAAVSFEYRARSYLEANCAFCHQPGAATQSYWDARSVIPGSQNGIIDGPLINNRGNPSNRVVAPGSLAQSSLFQRVANLGGGHMPPLSTSVINTEAVELLAAWITNELSGYVSYATWQANYFGDTNAPAAAPLADPDGDRAKNYLEYLTATNPTNDASGWKVAITLSNDLVQIVIPQVANRAIEVQSTTDLLDENSWTALDQPDNAPFFPITNRTIIVTDPATGIVPKFYRVRVIEP